MKDAFLALVRARLSADARARLLGFAVSRHDIGARPRQVLDLPISEESTVGIAVGMSRVGAEVFVDLMFDAFALRTMDVLVNQLALSRLRGHAAPLTIRVLAGPFVAAGPQHGGGAWALLARVPGVLATAPVLAEDVEVAWGLAARLGRACALVCGDAPIVGESWIEGEGLARVRRVGCGTRLVLVASGVHAGLVEAAVTRAGAWGETTLLVPLVLGEPALEAVLERVDGAARCIVLDSPAPATVGDLLVARLVAARPSLRCQFHPLWGQGLGAGFHPECVVVPLALAITGWRDQCA